MGDTSVLEAYSCRMTTLHLISGSSMIHKYSGIVGPQWANAITIAVAIPLGDRDFGSTILPHVQREVWQIERAVLLF